MALTKAAWDTNTIQSLPDDYVGYATALKVAFDKAASDIKTYVNSTLTAEIDALDAANAKLTGTQTIAGVKTFSSSPIVPTPTTDYQASTKKYVDDTDTARAAAVAATYDTIANITNNRKLSAAGDFTGTLNGAPITSSDPALSSTVATLVSKYGYEVEEPKNVLQTTSFTGTSLPTNWSTSGSWTVSNKLLSPASVDGGWNVWAYWNKYSTLDRTKITARIKIVNTATIFALMRRPPRPNVNTGGTVFSVHCTAKKIRVYENWDGDASSSALTASVISAADVSISADFVANREYICTMERNAGLHTFTLIDTFTGATTTLSYDNAYESTHCGNDTGCPGIIFVQGELQVLSFEFSTPTRYNPYLAFYGDSFVEGDSLIGLTNNYRARWAYKSLQELLWAGQDVLISGRGGAQTADLVLRADVDIDMFRPKYAVVLIGVNDSVAGTAETNITSILAKLVARGTTPLLCTIPPYAAKQTYINTMNAWIKTQGYTIINLAAALSDSNDEITQNSALFCADLIHPNAAGHEVMYQLVKNTISAQFFRSERKLQPYACVRTSSIPTIHTGTGTAAFDFGTEVYDTDDMWKVAAPSKLTINTAGIYVVNGTANFNVNATGWRFVGIKKNGSTYVARLRLDPNSASEETDMTVSATYYFAAGDYIELIALQTSGGDLDFTTNPELSALKIGDI